MFTTLLVQPLFNILFSFYAVVHDFGIAIIMLTILVRIFLWPLVTKQLKSQKKLQALQPKIVEARKQANGDRHKETQLIMEVYKEHGTSPFASITPMLVQLPIFFALYIALRDAIHPNDIVRLAYEPVKNFEAVKDIISSGEQFHPTLLGLVDLTKPSWVIALLAGLAQFYQSRQLMPKNTADLDAATRATLSLTYIFPIFTVFIGLSFSAALALYWTTTSVAAIFQQWYVLRQGEAILESEAKVTVTSVKPADQKAVAATTTPKKPAKKKASTKAKKKSA